MATPEQLVAKLGLDTRAFDRGLRQSVVASDRASKSMGASFRQTAMRVTAVVTAVTALTAATGQLAERGAKVSAVQRAFVRQVGDQHRALNLLRDATLGLVGDFDLMVQANQAFTLGSAKSVEEAANLASVATRLGRALGLDVGFALNSLNTGIARQSRLLLDNLGIIVDVAAANANYARMIGVATSQLTEADKAEAFRIEAMRQATEAADRLGDEVRNAGEAWRFFKVEAGNAFDELAKATNESGTLTSFFTTLGSLIRRARTDFMGMVADFREHGPLFGLIFAAAGGRPSPNDFGVTPRRQRIPRLELPPINVPQVSPLLTNTLGDFTRRQRITPPGGGQLDTLTRFGIGPLGPDPGGGGRISQISAAIGEAEARSRKWADAIRTVGETVENVLVRSLTRAIMRFESISQLIKDIGRSLLSSVVGGLVSFGVRALTTAALNAVAPGVGTAVGIAGVNAPIPGFGGPSPSPSPVGIQGLTLDLGQIPEPADYGILATKPQLQSFLYEAIREMQANG